MHSLPASAEPPLLRLHHIGYLTRSIENAAATHQTRYAYVPATPVIHDPLQTAFVQFLRLPGERTYLELVAPDGPQSKLANSFKRGALNHLCYTSGPLEEAIGVLEARGLRLISDPQPALGFGGRRICWLMGEDLVPIELVERHNDDDACEPGLKS